MALLFKRGLAAGAMNIQSKKLLFIYFMFMHIFLLFVLFKSDFTNRVYNFLVKPSSEKSNADMWYFDYMVDHHLSNDSNIPDGAIVFIGDSIMSGLDVSEIAPNSLNYGIGNDTTVGVLKRLSKYKSVKKATAVVLSIGINDTRSRSNGEILRLFSSIIDEIPEQVPFIISSIFQVNDIMRKDLQGVNSRIAELNSGLKQLCASQLKSRCEFVTTGAKITDYNGNMKPEYTIDGVHLTGEANSLWVLRLELCDSTSLI